MNRKVGYIVGEVETGSFGFVSDEDNYPLKHEYLVIPGVRERIRGEIRRVDVLAQVTNLWNLSDVLRQELSLRELETILQRYKATVKVFGKAKVLGYLDEEDQVVMPRSAAIPGQEVYVAPSQLLERFFTNVSRLSIPIGGLLTREEVPVRLDPNGFRRHVAVIAQTGAGKSYLVGLMLENLLPLGATIIVMDPNSDYVMMKKKADGGETPFAEDVTIYRPPGIKGRRFSDEDIGGAEGYTIEFSALTPDEIFEIAGVSPRWVHIRAVILEALQGLSGLYGPQQLLERLKWMEVNEEDRGRREAAARAQSYIQRLTRYQVWGSANIPLEELLRPRHLSVIDLAGLQSHVSQYIVQKTVSDIWARAITGSLRHPVFLVLEEAHNFAPAEGVASACSSIIEKVASEGRKFGVFLLVVTQRPFKINSNVLSQCNSQIIMRLTNPEDMSAVRRSSEAMSEDLFRDLPGLNRGEAIVVGGLTKVPVMVKVGGRVSAEGGSDIDLEAALTRALEEAERRKALQPQEDEDEEFKARW
ncbi:MAG TPA: ATP-binding protein [Candidatus Bathyarchaeota archaeon]|nr:ATP-binding protein [Candidatus Bathyarchaeota archaeon]